MKDSWKRGLLVGAVGVGACVFGGGCLSDNDSSIFIRSVLAPSTDCSYSADPGSMYLMGGVMDLLFVRQYKAVFLVGNQLAAMASTEKNRTETATFQADGLEVRVETWDGNTVLSQFSTVAVGTVEPASGSTPGWGSVASVIVDRGAIGGIVDGYCNDREWPVQRVASVVRLFGRTLGGKQLETGEYRYPIELCMGCTVSLPDLGCKPDDVTVSCTCGQDSMIGCGSCVKTAIGKDGCAE